jgi:enoyl-CoA hydratase/carnithine racemase
MIDVETKGGLRIVALDRQDKANALTHEMLTALSDCVERASLDPSVRVLALTGRGKIFSAGADLAEARAGLATDPVWERLSSAVADAPILTIAVLNGTAAGGALGMVLAADLRISVPGANFFYPVMKLGFLPQPSDPARLVRLVGPARAKLILMGGARISAEEALSMGLVDRIANDPLAEAQRIAADALAADRAHVCSIKEMLG